jgi:hypothetical protein
MFGMDRDVMENVLDEARRQGLRSATHLAVEETTARDFAELGGTTVEHFYGVADAALDGIQDFPPEHNASNEIHRFGRAGELYLQRNLNKEKLSSVLDLMVKNKVYWSPTMVAYLASRDLIRAQPGVVHGQRVAGVVGVGQLVFRTVQHVAHVVQRASSPGGSAGGEPGTASGTVIQAIGPSSSLPDQKAWFRSRARTWLKATRRLALPKGLS